MSFQSGFVVRKESVSDATSPWIIISSSPVGPLVTEHPHAKRCESAFESFFISTPMKTDINIHKKRKRKEENKFYNHIPKAATPERCVASLFPIFLAVFMRTRRFSKRLRSFSIFCASFFVCFSMSKGAGARTSSDEEEIPPSTGTCS